MPPNTIAHEVVVIGAGPGGYAAAFRAADLGMAVTLVDPAENPGGVCLYRGCIPSKALLHVAKIVSEAKEAESCGVTFAKPQIDISKLQAWKAEVVTTLTGGLGQLVRQRKIQYLRGNARFTGPNTLDVRHPDGKAQAILFKHAIIATGSRPAKVKALDIDSARVLDSTGALELGKVPKSLLVVGGGYIGLELGSVYAALGTQVTVVEMLPTLLPGADSDLVRVLHKCLAPRFESVLLETTVKGFSEEKKGVRVTFDGKHAPEKDIVFEQVLVSVGRSPHTADLGLENTRVQRDERGFIRTDGTKKTHEPSIYAIGDVAGEPMLAHKASHEGRIAVEAIAGRPAAFEPTAIPAVVFTDPEVAWCGLSESGARTGGRTVEVARFPWAASGRARTLGRAEGLTKLVIDPQTERVLGAGIVGPGAGELIAEAALAIEMGAVASDIGLTIHPHPTLSETLMEAADVFFGHATHVYRPKRRPVDKAPE